MRFSLPNTALLKGQSSDRPFCATGISGLRNISRLAEYLRDRDTAPARHGIIMPADRTSSLGIPKPFQRPGKGHR